MSANVKQRPAIDQSQFSGVDWGTMGRWDITKIDDDDLRSAILFIWCQSPGNYRVEAAANFLLAETNRRLTNQMQLSNEKSGKSSLWIALIALGISIFSLAFSFLDYRSSNNWQEEEVGLLKQQVELMQRNTK